MIGPEAVREPEAGLLGELVRTADEEGSVVRFDPVRDRVLASGLIEIGFECHDGPAGRCLIRALAQPTGRPGP